MTQIRIGIVKNRNAANRDVERFVKAMQKVVPALADATGMNDRDGALHITYRDLDCNPQLPNAGLKID